MARAGILARDCLDLLGRMVRTGVTGRDLDLEAEKFIRAGGGLPAFKGYRGYPATICASRNEVVIHGIPDDKPLVEGDLLSIDLGVYLDGYFADLAETFPVGVISKEKQALLRIGREALEKAIEKVRPGVGVDLLGETIEATVQKAGFTVVRTFCGHGIGRQLHEKPEIPNYAGGMDFILCEGLALAIEPMVNYKACNVEVLSDGWTVVTSDREPSVHFEDTVFVTAQGSRVLTRR